ncbi:MAG: phBC6A51 family helix-turn-helix protein [Thermodesulfobacteriota bacterium]
MSNKKNKKVLNFKQQQAIIEIIKPNKKTFTAIARNIGVNPRTLYSWRKQKEFSQALKKTFNNLKRKVESSAVLPIQLQAVGDGKNYKAKALNQVNIAKTLNELKEQQDNLIKLQEIYESELEKLYKIAELLRKDLIQNKEDIEKIKTKIVKD